MVVCATNAKKIFDAFAQGAPQVTMGFDQYLYSLAKI